MANWKEAAKQSLDSRGYIPPEKRMYELKDKKGNSYGEISYDAYKAVVSDKLDNYVPKNDTEKKAITDFNNYVSKNKTGSEKKSNKIFERYNIDPNNFTQKDFLNWLEKNNMQVIDADNTGITYKSKVKGGFLGIGGKELATEQQKKDADVLYELSKNNYRGSLAKKDSGAVASALTGFADSLAFGGVKAVGEAVAKKQYEQSGLDSSDYVSTRQAWGETQGKHPVANVTGNIAGSMASLGVLGKGVGAATQSVKWISNARPWIQSAINSGITFAIADGAETAFDTGDIKKTLINAGSGLVGGAIGGSLSAKVGEIGNKILSNSKYRNKIIAEIARSGVAGSAFAAGKLTPTLFYPKEYRPTGEQIAKDIGSAFAFAAISSAIGAVKTSGQNKKILDELYQKMSADYENMARSNSTVNSDGSVTTNVTNLADNVLKYTDAMENYLNGKGFEIKVVNYSGESGLTTNNIAGNNAPVTETITQAANARFVGQDKYVKTILSELNTIRNNVMTTLNEYNAKVSNTSSNASAAEANVAKQNIVPNVEFAENAGTKTTHDNANISPISENLTVKQAADTVKTAPKTDILTQAVNNIPGMSEQSTTNAPNAKEPVSAELEDVAQTSERIERYAPSTAGKEIKNAEDKLISMGADDASRKKVIATAVKLSDDIIGTNETLTNILNRTVKATKKAVTALKNTVGTSDAYWNLFSDNFYAVTLTDEQAKSVLMNTYSNAFVSALKNNNPKTYASIFVTETGTDISKNLPGSILNRTVPDTVRNVPMYKSAANEVYSIASIALKDISDVHSSIYNTEKRQNETMSNTEVTSNANELYLKKVGDFCEIYGEGAKAAANAIGAVPTYKAVDGKRTLVVGFPFKYIDDYAKRLAAFNLNIDTGDGKIIPLSARDSAEKPKTENYEPKFIDNRDIESVGKRNVKAFQYEHPQIRPFYSAIANELLNDLSNTIKGERIQIPDDSKAHGDWTGVKRFTSPAIAEIKDTLNVTYDNIHDALERIINDNGQENYALAKKIELVIDNMLTNGYKDFEGRDVPQNMEYIKAKSEIKGTDGSEYIHNENVDLPTPEVEDNLIKKAPEQQTGNVQALSSNVQNDSVDNGASANSVTRDKENTNGAREKKSANTLKSESNNDIIEKKAVSAALTGNQSPEPSEVKVDRTDIRKKAVTDIAEFVRENLEKNTKITSNALFDIAKSVYGGTMSDGAFTPKDAYDAMELGVNEYILSMSDISAQKMLDILELLPTQTRRTEEMLKYQQFSTPPSIAYLANYAANVNAKDIMLEPSAGVGGIAVFAKRDGAKVYVNELDGRRLEILKNMPFDGFFNENAEQINNILGDKIEPTVIVMNPPFSSSSERNIKGTEIGAKHIEQALKILAPNGRLVAIVGRGMNDGAAAFKEWWKDIKSKYNVRANIGIKGKNYNKYGTNFDIQMLVIDKDGSTAGTETGYVDTLQELQEKLGGIRNERPTVDYSTNERRTPATTRTEITEKRKPGRIGIGTVSDAGSIANKRKSADNAGSERYAERENIHAADSKSGGNAIGEPEVANDVDGKSDRMGNGLRTGTAGIKESDRTGVDDSKQSDRPVRRDEHRKRIKRKELTDSIFEHYQTQPLKVKNAQPHPAKVSESAAMSAIEPPPITYKPNIPQDIIDRGVVSDVQLEAISYAGQSHMQTLPNGNTRGFFLGDGTGIGKGRTIAGMILDNYNQGRKKSLWVTLNSSLVNDAKRDVKALFGNSDMVTQFVGGNKADSVLNTDEAIMVISYSALAKGFDNQDSNFNKIVNWLGKDFDGLIVFDESHKMGNSTDVKGTRGVKKASQTGLAGIALQEVLPKAKIVYSSATGATEVENLRYAERLGLWGDGTAFVNGNDFVSKIKAGGLAAMELIARDMKAMGVYLSRNISYEDVQYDKITHKLTEQQRRIYDELARSWQIVLKNINKALETTNQSKDGTARGRALGAFWSSQQRFFNQILTSMQVPSVISDIEKQLANGKSCVIQLVSTNESAQNQEFERLKAEDLELEEFDLTPKQMLMSYIENSFPVQQYEKYRDDNGNIKSKAVYDSQGNPVLNRDAIKQREELLEKLGSIKVPSAPIDMIINHFGTDMVAENTGRMRRVVKKGGKNIEEKIGSKKDADVDAFQNGKKRIIIFSKAGGTGKSYHADKSAKNQQQRVHYLLEAGWQADNAVQGFGRSHRSNQASAPIFKLVTTNLKGQMRFISTIAKRLDQLGAMTKGQRQAGGQGMFSANDNLENSFAADVLAVFYKDLAANSVDGIDDGIGIIDKLGLKDKILDDYNRIIVTAPELREVNKFLNRILSLESTEQNIVFDGYSERLQDATEKAMQAGTFDRGLENYKADKITLNEVHDIRDDVSTGAKTKYYNLTAENKIKPVKFSDLPTGSKSFVGFYRNKTTGNIRAAVRTSSVTDQYGNVSDNFKLIGQSKNEYISQNRFYGNWTKLDSERAETLWNEEVSKLPEYQKENLHLISGVVLPVWDKLPTENVRIYRVLTSDGDMLIGRVIPENKIDETLKLLGSSRTKEKIPTSDLISGIKNGDTVYLENGWKITQRRVSNENRIELIGAGYSDYDSLIKKGVFTERIQYNTRYFIPALTNTDTVMNAIIKQYPVLRVEKPKYSLAEENDKIKSREWSQNRGLQLPKLADTNPDDNIILYKDDIVNMYNTQNSKKYSTESEEADNVRTNLLSGNSKRGRDESPGKQIERISEYKQKIKGKTKEERSSYAKEILAKGNVEEVVNGDAKYSLVKPEGYNEDMRAIVSEAKTFGKDVSFFVGNALRKFDGQREFLIDGIKMTDNEILIRYDGAYSPQMLLVHELVHTEWNNPEMQKSKDIILDTLVESERKEILSNGRYKDYMDLYDNDEEAVWEEFVADVFANMNDYSDSYVDTVVDYWYNGKVIDRYNPSEYINSMDAGGNNAVLDSVGFGNDYSLSYDVFNIPYNEKRQLDDYVLRKNHSSKTLKKIDCKEIGNNFYIWNNNSKIDYTIIDSIPIVGNEQIINELRSGIVNGTYRGAKSVSEWSADVRSRRGGSTILDSGIEGTAADGGNDRLSVRKSKGDTGRNSFESDSDKNPKYALNSYFEKGAIIQNDIKKRNLGNGVSGTSKKKSKDGFIQYTQADFRRGMGEKTTAGAEISNAEIPAAKYALSSYETDAEDLTPERKKQIFEQFEKDRAELQKPTKKQLWGERAAWVAHNMTRVFPNIPERGERGTFFAEFRKDMIQWKGLPTIASFMVQDKLNKMTNGLTPDEFKTFSELVYFLDLQEEAQLQKEKGYEEILLPNEITPGEVDAIVNELNGIASENVKQALIKRQSIWEELKTNYIELNRYIGFDTDGKFKRKNYYHHQVIDYMNNSSNNTGGGEIGIKAGRGWLKERQGSIKAINTDFLTVEYKAMLQMQYDVYIAETLGKIKQQYDIKPRLENDAFKHNKDALNEIIRKEATGKDGDIVFDTKGKPDSETFRKQMWFNSRIMFGFDGLFDLADRNALPTFDGEYSEVVAALKRHELNVSGLYKYVGTIAATEPAENAIDAQRQAVLNARTVLKYTSRKKAWIKEVLGDDYQTWESLAKEMKDTYTIHQPRRGNYFYTKTVIDEDAFNAAYNEMVLAVSSGDVNFGNTDVKELFKQYSDTIRLTGAAYEQWVLPKEIVDTMNDIANPKQTAEAAKAARAIVSAWKGWATSVNPLRTVKFGLRNLGGDLDAVIAGNPKAVMYSKKAVHDIYRAMKHKEYSPEYMEWITRGGYTSMIFANEMDLEMQDKLFSNLKDKSGAKVFDIPAKAFEKYYDGVENVHNFREAILRYSSYLYFKETINRNNGKVKDYVASNKYIVNGLNTVEDKAYQLSKDLLGAYDEVGKMGQTLRRYWVPFYSFTETNLKRYYRLFENVITSNDSIPKKAGKLLLKALMVNMLGLLMFAWNRLVMKDADDELPPSARNIPHITFGKIGDNVYAFRQLGSFSEILEWFGLDDYKLTTDDFVAPLDKAWGMITPFVKMPIELISGLNFYPSLSNPRAIRDKWQHFFNSLGVSDLYNVVTGKPTRGIKEIAKGSVIYDYDYKESAYYEILDIKRNYQGKNDNTIYGSDKKSNALYYMKTAVRYKDKKAALKYLDVYFENGGTVKGIRQSISMLNPMYGYTSEDTIEKGEEFIKSLSDEEREKLKIAQDYYENDLMLPENVFAMLGKSDITEEEAKNVLRTYINSKCKKDKQ